MTFLVPEMTAIASQLGTGYLGLAKLGGDKLALDGTNAFTGQTIVEDGTLDVESAFGSSPVELAGGQVEGNAAASSVATTVALLSDADPNNPPAYGAAVEFTATVGATNPDFGTPTGTVDFYDEATGEDSGPVGLTDGQANWTFYDFDAGDHYVVASYSPASGTSPFVGDTCGECDQTVNQAQSDVTNLEVYDVTQGQDTDNPTYGDQISITATVGPDPSTPGGSVGTPDDEGNTGTVDFYDQTSGNYLGQANVVPSNDDSGMGTATWGGCATGDYNLAVGSYSIIAVYSGDDNFSGSQSSGTSVNVVGDTLSFGNSLSVSGPGCDSGISYEGDAATLSGTVTGLDGAAFSVSVNWGDGTQSDNDNGGQPFYFPVGWNSRTFGVSHYYSDYGSYTVSVTVTASDGRQTGNSGNSVDLTVSPVAPEVIVDSSPLPDDGAYDPNTQYTLMAYGFSPDQGSVSYQWTADGNDLPATNVQTTLSDGTVVTGSSVQVMGSQCDDVTVAVSSGSAYRDVNFGDTRDALGWAEQELPLPTVSISETDTNQTVSAGSQAHFEIQLSRAVTYGVTVCYNTVDGTNGPPIDYDSTYGPQEVTIAAGQTAVTLPTNAGQPDGALDPVTVSLVDPFLCQVDSSGGGGGGATANVQDPQLQIYLTGVENDEMILISSGGPVNVKVGE